MNTHTRARNSAVAIAVKQTGCFSLYGMYTNIALHYIILMCYIQFYQDFTFYFTVIVFLFLYFIVKYSRKNVSVITLSDLCVYESRWI
jgi:hypothetical protein